MENTDLILNKLEKIGDQLTDVKVAHGRLDERSEQQNKKVVESIDLLAKNIGAQNGRVTKLELFRNTIMTKMKTIPATISAVFGGITIAITMYLRTK